MNEDRRLSLIDVSFEDDCLYSSPPPLHLPDKQSEMINEGAGLVDDTIVQRPEELSFETKVPQPIESPEVRTHSGKYNLRKSLAWDSAFFTSAGVLEPEELSCMIGRVQKSGKCVLPEIEEEVHKSSDSISTLASDSLALETIEADLFGDVRASIQKSSKSSDAAAIAGSGTTAHVAESKKASHSSEKEEAARNKVKAMGKKPIAIIHGSGKLTKDSLGAPSSQSTRINGNVTLSKPPKVVGRISSHATPATKPASLSANNRVKVERDGSKNSSSNLDSTKKLLVAGIKPASSGGLQRIPQRPGLPSKPALSSLLPKEKALTAASFRDSSESLSSDSSSKSSSSSARRVSGSRTGIHHNHPSGGSIAKNALRVGPKCKNQSITHLSPHVTSVHKLSSCVSPTSSVSEWSSGSLSPTSILNNCLNGLIPNIDTASSKDVSGDSDSVTDSESHDSSFEKCSVLGGTQVADRIGGNVKRVSTGSSALPNPELFKPTGLRMPSPKIGFFDGVKSAIRTPTGSMRPRPALTNVLPRSNAETVGSSEGLNKVKLGKLQPSRTSMAVRNPKIFAQQHAQGMKSRSSLPVKESSDSAQKACDSSNFQNGSPGISPKVGNEKVSGNEGGSTFEANTQASSDTAMRDPVLNCKEDEMDLESNSSVSVKGAAFTSVGGGANNASDNNGISGAEKLIVLQEVGADTIGGQNLEVNNLGSLCDSDLKYKVGLENQVDDLAKQVEAMSIHGGV